MVLHGRGATQVAGAGGTPQRYEAVYEDGQLPQGEGGVKWREPDSARFSELFA